MTQNDLLDMPLHSSTLINCVTKSTIGTRGFNIQILRVAGGWIYTLPEPQGASVFVPEKI